MTIDLTAGFATIQFLPPLFKDNKRRNVQLLDPTNPLRQITLKLVGQGTSELNKLISYKLIKNMLLSPFVPASVNLAKLEISNLEAFEVIVCWSYGNYSNLANLCNESTRHTVVNALGYCLTEFEVLV